MEANIQSNIIDPFVTQINSQNDMSVAVRIAMQNGFSKEQGIAAESAILAQFGEECSKNEDLILSYLMEMYLK